MKCPNCNTEVGGLVELNFKEIFDMLFDRTQYSVDSCKDIAEEICSRFGTPKEKVELDEKELWDTLTNYGFEGYQVESLVKVLTAKFSIPKTSVRINREKLANELWYRYAEAERGSFYNNFSTISEEKRQYWLKEADKFISSQKEWMEI